jgi:hypothetical protein
MDSVFFDTVEYKFVLHDNPSKIVLSGTQPALATTFKCSKSLI